MFVANRGSHRIVEICNIGIRRFTTWKKKQQQNFTSVLSIEPGTSAIFGSDALSEFPSGAGTIDYIYKISQVTHASIGQREKYQIQMAKASGLILIGVTFCCWIFCFHIVKLVMPF